MLESICQVCELPRNDIAWRNAAQVCTACNSFFKDTIDGENFNDLKCKQGDNKCLLKGAMNETAIVCGNGRVWRFTCKKCRFDKCLAVGMKRLRRVKKRKQTKSEMAADKQLSPVNVVPTGEEPFLSTITNQFQTMRRDFLKAAPLVNQNDIKQEEFCEMFLKNCVAWGLHVCNLVKQLPGFKSLTIAERCAIYPMATSAINSLHLATHSSPFGNCSLQNIQLIAEKVPVLLHPFRDNYGPAQFRAQIMASHLDAQEQAFIAYLLYFGNEGDFFYIFF